MSDEIKAVNEQRNSTEVIKAYNRIPYGLLNAEIEGSAKDTLDEFTQICEYYRIYKDGAKFSVEGSNGDYVPATLRYKMAKSLIDKEARFLFAEPPTIQVEAKGDLGKTSEEAAKSITVLNDLVKTVLDSNMFEEQLIKAAKDCFIGKRVAGLVNFNEDDGVTITFLPATQFVYDTKMGNPNVITKFVAFIIVRDSLTLSDKRIFKKKFVLKDDGVVYLEEMLFDGAGALIEEVTTEQPIKLDTIPVAIFVNDGLTGEDKGESEIEILKDYESYYSKLANADTDAERKSMNPVKYAVDMEPNSTKGLSTAAGAFWDLGSDQNLDKPSPQVGMLEPNMSYSEALKTTLDRIKTVGYEQVDMPNITLESMTGAITSGKALKAVYWPLIVRCKEKMKMWAPQLRRLIDVLIQGAMQYPNTVRDYLNDAIVPVAYEISVEQNSSLPEDEIEEKQQDLSEVNSQVKSRKSYMQKWFGLTDDEVNEELEQMAKERQVLEDSALLGGAMGGDVVPYPDAEDSALESGSDGSDDVSE